MSIQIIGNVGNAGFALPMVQAYPTDPSLQNLLAWDPVNQALNYTPYTGNALGDFGVTRDLAVTRNATIGGTLGVTGAVTLASTLGVTGVLTTQNAAPAVIPAISGNLTFSGTGIVNLGANGRLQIASTQVVGPRDTGWANGTGTPQKTTFTTAGVTLPQLAGVVMAMQTMLTAHGLMGP